MTISRCIDFRLQPRATNSVASQSSSSGCVGSSPIVPKSLGVATRPRPKWCCQSRLTITRAVSGWSGRTSHSASAVRRPVERVDGAATRAAAGIYSGTSTAGNAGATSGPLAPIFTAAEQVRRRRDRARLVDAPGHGQRLRGRLLDPCQSREQLATRVQRDRIEDIGPDPGT